ncbi:methyltransferase domain-containing protein [Phycicoccus sp. BSK3Z-2]|uniref:Methyltransferase domain-containing protein n=1 Tax=Phycicoccus avicenniae TaxID=2828860 RepID=A0A941I011_9MICO|nr:methyltransferase domain-containing protein [Phycicoccus avicenniae]MBR7742714.1 methyltransferase domain-containing protein [Phycicoccus avicenniae]
MARYGTLMARTYDVLSGEPVYGVGRRVAVRALGLRPGDRVLDVGCGTGLNLPLLLDAVGPEGTVVGLDRSAAMLRVARRKARGHPSVRLVAGDAADPAALDEAAGDTPFDAVLATYSLSLMPDPAAVWRAVRGVLAPTARVAVVDMAVPTGPWAWAAPLARAACALGGADIDAHPWEVVERDLAGVRSWSRRGGHVRVSVGTLP